MMITQLTAAFLQHRQRFDHFGRGQFVEDFHGAVGVRQTFAGAALPGEGPGQPPAVVSNKELVDTYSFSGVTAPAKAIISRKAAMAAE